MRTPFDISVREACHESWDGMSGSSQGRFCERCQKNVHDLAQMSPAAVEVLAMRAAAGRPVCGRVTRRSSGELVTLPAPSHAAGHRARSAALSVAVLATLPAAAQKSEAPRNEAVLTGQLRHPDGSAVESGLIHVSGLQEDALYVADDRGRFELHLPPGAYDITLITAEYQGEAVRSAVLHGGMQELGQVSTQAGRRDLAEETTVFVGELVGTTSWSWKARLRHPVLYVRSLVQRRS